MLRKSKAPDGSVRVVASLQEFERLMPIVKSMDGDVKPMRGDVVLVVANGRQGAAAVLEQRERVRQELPAVSIEAIEQVPAAGEALMYAAGEVERFREPASGVMVLRKRAATLRKKLSTAAVSLVTGGVFTPEQVDGIGSGKSGPIKAANRLIALAALFEKNAHVVEGKTVVTMEDVKEASDVGQKLLAVLEREGAPRRPKNAALEAAIEARNRLWTYFLRLWREARRAAAYLFEDDVEVLCPKLGSRVRKRVKKSSAPPNKTAPPPTPAVPKIGAA
jgi:hypothetical protein